VKGRAYTTHVVSSSVETTSGSVTSISRAQQRARVVRWLLFVIVLGGLLATRMWLAQRASLPKPLVDLPAYTLTDHHGKPFGAANLRGKPYIADFVFTSCPSVCPRLTQRMLEIQRRTEDLGDALHLVTFSVDPETDTPERLAAYARKYEANEARWTFLTGQLGEVETVIVKGFKIALGKTETSPGIFDIFHGERFVLVDGEGKVRGYYDANDEGVEAIIRDARRFAKP
jgi:protein SCO1